MHPVQNNQPDPKLYYSLFDLKPWESIPTHTVSFCHHKWAKLCDSLCCISLFPPASTLCLPPPSMLGIDSSYGSEDNTGVWGLWREASPADLPPSGEVITEPSGKKGTAAQNRKTSLLLLSRNDWWNLGFWGTERQRNLPNSLFLFPWSHSFLYMPECPQKRREVYRPTLRCSSEPWRIRPWVLCFDLVSSTTTRQKTVLWAVTDVPWFSDHTLSRTLYISLYHGSFKFPGAGRKNSTPHPNSPCAPDSSHDDQHHGSHPNLVSDNLLTLNSPRRWLWDSKWLLKSFINWRDVSLIFQKKTKNLKSRCTTAVAVAINQEAAWWIKKSWWQLLDQSTSTLICTSKNQSLVPCFPPLMSVLM